jgi:hypothetical protein
MTTAPAASAQGNKATAAPAAGPKATAAAAAAAANPAGSLHNVLAKNTPLFRSLLTVLDIAPEQIEDSTVGTFFAPSDEVGWLGAAVDKEEHAGLYVLMYACICVWMGLRSQSCCMHAYGRNPVAMSSQGVPLASFSCCNIPASLERIIVAAECGLKCWLGACHMHACKGGCAVQTLKHALGPAE